LTPEPTIENALLNLSFRSHQKHIYTTLYRSSRKMDGLGARRRSHQKI